MLLGLTREQTSAVDWKYARLGAVMASGPAAKQAKEVFSAKLAISPKGVQGPLAPGAGARGPQRPSLRRSFKTNLYPSESDC